MHKSDFEYSLPENLVAQYPPGQRGQSRLLVLDKKKAAIQDRKFADLPDLLQEGDVLVFNNTRVIPARLFGNKETGGRVEIMVERVLDKKEILVQLRYSKEPRTGSRILVEGGLCLEVLERRGTFHVLCLQDGSDITRLLEQSGHIPLPPYIQRQDDENDRERYQTVYAQVPGAVAAPTAGLHFTLEMLEKLQEKGIRMAYVTLHVGAGTFQPVRTGNIESHRMHSEFLEVDETACDRVNTARAEGNRVIAVGTTAVRCLETAVRNGKLHPYSGETDLFIYPGFSFVLTDAMITNFHLPASTLLMLVCAFAGRENVLNAYQHAIRHEYRFYSYGDAMFIA